MSPRSTDMHMECAESWRVISDPQAGAEARTWKKAIEGYVDGENQTAVPTGDNNTPRVFTITSGQSEKRVLRITEQYCKDSGWACSATSGAQERIALVATGLRCEERGMLLTRRI